MTAARPEAPPAARLVHELPGRLRLRLAPDHPALKDSEGLCDLIATLEGVLRVALRRSTGSLLIEHQTTGEALIESLVGTGRFEIAPREQAPSALPRPSFAARSDLTRALFLGLAAVEAFRGNLLPPAVTLLHYAGVLTVEPPSRPQSEEKGS